MFHILFLVLTLQNLVCIDIAILMQILYFHQKYLICVRSNKIYS